MSPSPPAALIRQWARDAGIAVGERGRLAPEVLSAYAAAHPQTTEAVALRRAAGGTATSKGFRIAARPAAEGGVNGRRVRARSQ